MACGRCGQCGLRFWVHPQRASMKRPPHYVAPTQSGPPALPGHASRYPKSTVPIPVISRRLSPSLHYGSLWTYVARLLFPTCSTSGSVILSLPVFSCLTVTLTLLCYTGVGNLSQHVVSTISTSLCMPVFFHSISSADLSVPAHMHQILLYIHSLLCSRPVVYISIIFGRFVFLRDRRAPLGAVYSMSIESSIPPTPITLPSSPIPNGSRLHTVSSICLRYQMT
ncbi:hypothetical protein EDD18DRAFT_113448 [Armillaria luteobubalina]|uniref:Uncharacterized protein n=1 Tax=Armillaria luteobubalina TaxID=153913 RepID=A0AA39Q7X8_9AGAR|nr:hypothetical protein EDD18DRAFT_113448 [Armillaria luteobubalina]